MKTLFTLASLALVIGSLTPNAFAEDKKAAASEEKHDHAQAPKVGPTNGRLLTEVEPHAEFLVTKDKKVEIRFVDDANKVVAPKDQVVTVTLGDRAKPTKLAFTKEGDKLVSDKTIPEGNDYPTIVSIKSDAKAKAVNSKFSLNLSKCPSCENAEYNCTCEHGGDEHKDAKKAK